MFKRPWALTRDTTVIDNSMDRKFAQDYVDWQTSIVAGKLQSLSELRFVFASGYVRITNVCNIPCHP